jgi:hypothetical protein
VGHQFEKLFFFDAERLAVVAQLKRAAIRFEIVADT